jgi:hypothetical protein
MGGRGVTDKTMIVLVSDQPMPNLLTATHPSLNLKEIILIQSQRMAVQAERLIRVLTARGLKVKREFLENAYDPEPCRELVQKLVGDDPGSFIINVTGGTKVMAMGAYLAAIKSGVRDIIYIDHAEGKARWLSSESILDNRPLFDLESVISLQEVLDVHGFSRKKESEQPTEFVDFSTKLIQADHNTIAALNRSMQAARKVKNAFRNKKPVSVGLDTLLEKNDHNNITLPVYAKEAQAYLQYAAQKGLCRISKDQIEIPGRDECTIIGGGWLEIVTWKAMKDYAIECGMKTTNIRYNIKIKGKAGAENEIDVIALHGRTLYIIECKTGVMSGGEARVVNPADIFYKLHHLRSLGGLKTKLALVSLHKLSCKQRKRFEEGDIHIIDGEEVQDLKGALAGWLDADKGANV